MQETIQIHEKQPRQNLSVADKEQYYRQWKQSGLSRSQFCREQKLSIATFCNWVKHFEERKSSVARESTFIPVTQISPVPTLEISLSNGLRCCFSGTLNARFMAELIQELSHDAGNS